MKIIKAAVLMMGTMIVINCTHTRLVSFTDANAANKLYHQIGIIANVENLSDRLTIENKIVETLKGKGVRTISSFSLFPPTRDFTIEQENEILIKNGVDAILVIQLTDAGYSISSEPIQVHTGTSNTTISGGGTEHKAFGQLRISLVDILSNQTMWVGDADTRAFFNTINPDWDMTYLLKASSKKIAKELVSTGLVKIYP